MPLKSTHTTAILVFAYTANEELRHKKIALGGQLFDALTQHTLKTVEKTGIPFYHITENQQKGNSFGKRFTNAIQDVLDLGYETIITVGNDSPHLTKTHLLNTVLKLEQGESVIGPSADGGFYLMGLHRSDFNKSEFEELSWQTAQLRKEILGLLSASTREVHLLPALFDLDTFRDAQIIAKKTSGLSSTVLQILRSMVSTRKKLEFPSFFFVQGLALEIPSNKGSPVHSFS